VINTETTTTKKGLMFCMGTERYVIGLDEVDGIMENKRPVSIPGAPPYVTGILNIRGTLTVLIDLRKLMGIDGSRRADIIMMNIEGKSIGLVVDKVDDILNYTDEEVSPLPVEQNREHRLFAGLLRKEDETLILLNEDGIIKALEVES